MATFFSSISSLASYSRYSYRRIVPIAQCLRLTHTSSSPPEPGVTSTSSTIIQKLNHVFVTYPRDSVASLFLCEITSMGLMYNCLSVCNMQFSFEFAAAFALSRAFRRVRLPLELMVAAPIARMFPSLRELKMWELIQNAFRGSAVNSDTTTPSANSSSTASVSQGFFKRNISRVFGVINNYGAAYFLSSRLVGVCIIFTLYGVISVGTDLTAFVDLIGNKTGFNISLSPTLGQTLGTWAAAVTSASVLYPLSISCTVFLAPLLNRSRLGLLTRIRSMQKPSN